MTDSNETVKGATARSLEHVERAVATVHRTLAVLDERRARGDLTVDDEILEAESELAVLESERLALEAGDLPGARRLASEMPRQRPRR